MTVAIAATDYFVLSAKTVCTVALTLWPTYRTFGALWRDALGLVGCEEFATYASLVHVKDWLCGVEWTTPTTVGLIAVRGGTVEIAHAALSFAGV